MSRTRGSHDEQQYAATLQDIANHFGKTKEWARQEINKALSKVRAAGTLNDFQDILTRGNQ